MTSWTSVGVPDWDFFEISMVFCWVGVISSDVDELLSLSLSSLESLETLAFELEDAGVVAVAVVAVIVAVHVLLLALCGIFCAVIVTE